MPPPPLESADSDSRLRGDDLRRVAVSAPTKSATAPPSQRPLEVLESVQPRSEEATLFEPSLPSAVPPVGEPLAPARG